LVNKGKERINQLFFIYTATALNDSRVNDDDEAQQSGHRAVNFSTTPMVT